MIPKGWQESTISELAEVDPEALSSATDLAEEIDYISLEDVSRGRLLGSTRLAFSEAPSRARRVICEGDVLFGTVRPNLQSHLYFEGGFRRPIASTGFAVVRAIHENEPRFIFFSLMSDRTQTQVDRIIAGSNYPAVSSRDVRTLIVLAPPPKEQRAIAEALSDADALVESLDALIAKKRDMKHAAMQQLLTGRSRLPGFTDEWREIRLGNLGYTFGGLTGKSAKDFGVGSTTFVTFMNVISNVILSVKGVELVDVRKGEAQNQLSTGDVIFNGSSETPEEVGFGAAVPDELDGVYLNSFCFGFRCYPDADLDTEFFAYLTRSPIGREVIRPMAQGSTRYNIAKTILLNGQFLLPTLSEQQEIAEVLSDMDAEIDALVAQRDKAELVKQGMMQELLSGRVRLV